MGGVDSIPSQKILNFAIGPSRTSRWTLSRHHRAERAQMGRQRGGSASHSDIFPRPFPLASGGETHASGWIKGGASSNRGSTYLSDVAPPMSLFAPFPLGYRFPPLPYFPSLSLLHFQKGTIVENKERSRRRRRKKKKKKRGGFCAPSVTWSESGY